MTDKTGALKRWKKRLRLPRPKDISTPVKRAQALAFVRIVDHGILRALWHNMHEIAPGVWRSNYPDPARFGKLKRRGIKTIISLRGDGPTPWYLLEAEAAAAHGMTLEAVSLKSTKAPRREAIARLIALMRGAERPLLIHCKSGADRAGLASALYLLLIENRPLKEARRMLSPWYLHLRWSRAGVISRLLDEFAASGEPDFERWLAQDYDAEALQRRFDARRWG